MLIELCRAGESNDGSDSEAEMSFLERYHSAGSSPYRHARPVVITWTLQRCSLRWTSLAGAFINICSKDDNEDKRPVGAGNVAEPHKKNHLFV